MVTNSLITGPDDGSTSDGKVEYTTTAHAFSSTQISTVHGVTSATVNETRLLSACSLQPGNSELAQRRTSSYIIPISSIARSMVVVELCSATGIRGAFGVDVANLDARQVDTAGLQLVEHLPQVLVS